MKTLFWIYKSRVDKLGQSPIMLRLIIAKESKNFSTGVKIDFHAWDAQKQRIKGFVQKVHQMTLPILSCCCGACRMEVLTLKIETEVAR